MEELVVQRCLPRDTEERQSGKDCVAEKGKRRPRPMLRAGSFFFLFFLIPAVLTATVFTATGALAADENAAQSKKPEVAKESPAGPPVPYGQICRASVSYLWQPLVHDSEAEDSPQEAYFTTVSAQGEVLEDVKKALNSKLSPIQAQALQACRSEHQAQAGCVVKKLQSLSRTYPSMDFARRQTLMKSVRADCGRSQGSCLSTRVSEMKCWLNVPPGTVVPNEPKIRIEQGAIPERAEEGNGVEDDSSGVSGSSAETAASKPSQPKIKKVKRAKIKIKEQVPRPENSDGKTDDNPYNKPFNF
jgi:hypothetical protein